MVKNIIIVLIMLNESPLAKDVFEQHCVGCHKSLPTTLEEMLKNYLLLYSSEANVKIGIENYLRFPSREVSAMSNLFIDTYGVKKKITLNEKSLREAINIYWDKYNIIDKLK